MGTAPDDLLNLVLEVSGEARKDKAAKVATARNLWIPAINNHGGFGRWAFLEISTRGMRENTIDTRSFGTARSNLRGQGLTNKYFDEINYWSEIKLDIVRDYAGAYSRILAAQNTLPYAMSTSTPSQGRDCMFQKPAASTCQEALSMLSRSSLPSGNTTLST